MILLELHITLQKNQDKPAVTASPFLGGVLHGVLEHLVRLHAPAIGLDLGIAPGSRLKRYAILPPPYRWRPPADSESIVMQCGVVLYGQARQHAQIVAALFNQWDELRLKGRTDKIQCCEIQYHVPGAPPLSWQNPAQSILFDRQPDFTQTHQTSDHVTLNFFTPFKLGRVHQLAGSRLTPPMLLQIARSLTRRIVNVEPGLAAALGVGSLTWIEAEEQIRHLPAAWHQLAPVRWRYGSSTKPFLIPCSGLVGQIHYARCIPAAITALLHWGPWFGIGESTALGQGMYYVRKPLINFTSQR